MAAFIQSGDVSSIMRSGIIPAISVTPGNMVEIGFTLAQSYQPEVVDDDWITAIKVYEGKPAREVLEDLMITQDQISLIVDAYEATGTGAGEIRVQKNEWRKDEDINVSVWSDTPDIDIILGNLMDSVIADIQVGFVGDNSKIMNFKYRVTKGLTNFNYGRVLFGSEYNLTFTNTYCNFAVYQDDVIVEHDLIADFEIPGG